jgi:hypothetical protein
MIEPEWTNDVTVSDKEELRDTVEFFREVVQAVRGKLARGGREIPGYLMLNPDFQTLEIPRLVVRAHLMKRVIRMPNRNPEAQREGESPLPGEDLLPVLRGLLRSNDFEHLRLCGIPLSIVANLRRERRRQIWRMTRIVRAGWHVASHSVAASCRALAGPIPTSFASSTGEDLKSPKACPFHLLSHLLDGADIAALKRVGGTRSARQQRRVNSRLYSDILHSLKTDVREGRALVMRAFNVHGSWRKLDELFVLMLRLRVSLLFLWFAPALYRAHIPGGQWITQRVLGAMPGMFDLLFRLPSESQRDSL